MIINKEFEIYSKLISETKKITSLLTTNVTSNKLELNNIANAIKNNNSELKKEIVAHEKLIISSTNEMINKTINKFEQILNNQTKELNTNLTKKFDSIDSDIKNLYKLVSNKQIQTNNNNEVKFKVITNKMDDILFLLKDELGDLVKKQDDTITEVKPKDETKKVKPKDDTSGLKGSFLGLIGAIAGLIAVIGTIGLVIKKWNSIKQTFRETFAGTDSVKVVDVSTQGDTKKKLDKYESDKASGKQSSLEIKQLGETERDFKGVTNRATANVMGEWREGIFGVELSESQRNTISSMIRTIILLFTNQVLHEKNKKFDYDGLVSDTVDAISNEKPKMGLMNSDLYHATLDLYDLLKTLYPSEDFSDRADFWANLMDVKDVLEDELNSIVKKLIYDKTKDSIKRANLKDTVNPISDKIKIETVSNTRKSDKIRTIDTRLDGYKSLFKADEMYWSDQNKTDYDNFVYALKNYISTYEQRVGMFGKGTVESALKELYDIFVADLYSDESSLDGLMNVIQNIWKNEVKPYFTKLYENFKKLQPDLTSIKLRNDSQVSTSVATPIIETMSKDITLKDLGVKKSVYLDKKSIINNAEIDKTLKIINEWKKYINDWIASKLNGVNNISSDIIDTFKRNLQLEFESMFNDSLTAYFDDETIKNNMVLQKAIELVKKQFNDILNGIQPLRNNVDMTKIVERSSDNTDKSDKTFNKDIKSDTKFLFKNNMSAWDVFKMATDTTSDKTSMNENKDETFLERLLGFNPENYKGSGTTVRSTAGSSVNRSGVSSNSKTDRQTQSSTSNTNLKVVNNNINVKDKTKSEKEKKSPKVINNQVVTNNISSVKTIGNLDLKGVSPRMVF